MFFGSPIKKGIEAGEILWKQLSIGFLVMENLPLGGFNLPSDFFDDEYTISYTVSFIELLRIHRFSGKNWSEIKRAEFLQAAFNEIEPTGNLIKKVSESGQKAIIEGKSIESEAKIKGRDAAYATVGLMLGFVSSDDQNPVVKDSKYLAEMLSLPRSKEPFNIMHASSVTQITIAARVKERYGNKFNPSW